MHRAPLPLAAVAPHAAMGEPHHPRDRRVAYRARAGHHRRGRGRGRHAMPYVRAHHRWALRGRLRMLPHDAQRARALHRALGRHQWQASRVLVGGQSVGVGDQLSEEGAVTEYTALFPFCGIGGGALGFKRAEVSMFGRRARFRVVAGIDLDAASCRDFENIVAAPALCRDVRDLSPAELLELCPEAPDVVFLSPPCKGASGLLSAKKARTRRYREMNRLALRWIELMLATWPTPPRLVLLENVPRLKQRAGGMLRRVRSLLHRAGYVFHDGFHECGELGGLAQIRRRYLLVARRPSACPSLLYQPPRKRVRGCGEVLGPLPMPGDPAGG